MKTPIKIMLLALVGSGFIIASMHAHLYKTIPPKPIYNNIKVYLTGDINATNVAPIIASLNSATERDDITIVLTSPGGVVSEGTLVIEAMKESKAHKVTISVPYLAASMAAVMLCYADDLKIADSAILMYHAYRMKSVTGWVILTEVKAKESEDFDISFRTSKILMQPCFSKLTSYEIRGIFTYGRDIFLTGQEFQKRMSK